MVEHQIPFPRYIPLAICIVYARSHLSKRHHMHGVRICEPFSLSDRMLHGCVTLRVRLRATVHVKIFKMTLMCIICRLSMAWRAQIAVISLHIYTPAYDHPYNAQAPLPYSTYTTHNTELSSTPMSPQFLYISSIHNHSQLPSLSY